MLQIIEDRPSVAAGVARWEAFIQKSLVYVLDGRVVGFATRGVELHMVHALYVAEHYRGRGFGERLLHQVESQIEADGAPCVQLLVELTNPDARRLYVRLGYRDHHKTPKGWMMERLFGAPPALADRQI